MDLARLKASSQRLLYAFYVATIAKYNYLKDLCHLPHVITEDIILDRWSSTIQGAHGLAEEIYRGTETFIRESGAPGIIVEHQEVSPGFIQGLRGIMSDSIVVKNVIAPALGAYVVYIAASNYGNSLIVSWWLCSRVGAWHTLKVKGFYLCCLTTKWYLRAASWLMPQGFVRNLVKKTSDMIPVKKPQEPLTRDLDTFQKNIVLRGFSTTTHAAVVQAVEQLLQAPIPAQHHRHGFHF